MEQRAMIRFLTLKGFKMKSLQTKLDHVDENKAFEIGAVKNGQDISCGAKLLLK
jgi:hypothetical protein